MSQWKAVPKFIPTDGQLVWCRSYNETCPPFLATFDLASNTFIEQTHGIVYPAFSIFKWCAS